MLAPLSKCTASRPTCFLPRRRRVLYAFIPTSLHSARTPYTKMPYSLQSSPLPAAVHVECLHLGGRKLPERVQVLLLVPRADVDSSNKQQAHNTYYTTGTTRDEQRGATHLHIRGTAHSLTPRLAMGFRAPHHNQHYPTESISRLRCNVRHNQGIHRAAPELSARRVTGTSG